MTKRMDRTVRSSIMSKGVPTVTVPLDFSVDGKGQPAKGAKIKLEKGRPKVRIDRALKPLVTDPKYSDLYAACFEECRELHGARGLRVVGAEAVKLAKKRIAEIEQAERQAPARSKPPVDFSPQPARRPDPILDDNSLEAWEAALGDRPAEPEATEALTSWQPISPEELMQLEDSVTQRPKQAAGSWSEGFTPKNSQAAQASARRLPPAGDWLGVANLGPEPAEPCGYAQIDSAEGLIRFRFHWALTDEERQGWIIFVQDMRYPDMVDARPAAERLSDGPGSLQMSNDPEDLDQADAQEINTLANVFRFGDLVFVQYYFSA